MTQQTTKHYSNSLTIAVIISLLVGIYFLAPFFGVIAFSAIAAFSFFPLFAWLQKKLKKPSAAAAITVLSSFIIVIIPVLAIGLATFNELQQAAKSFTSYTQTTDLHELTQTTLEKTNQTLQNITGSRIALDTQQIQEFLTKNVSKVFNGIANFIGSSMGSVNAFFMGFILYVYLFTAFLLNHASLIRLFKSLNPLGDTASALYLKQAGAMTKAMVRGQFVIAIFQGFIGSLSLLIAGIDLFWILFLLLTVLSFIPLGGGILTIPIGFILLITGNIWQGIVVLATHFVVVTNVDNILRPLLVPKSARLNSALTILSVFAGLGMFGILGIVLGPVLMILIVTTIRLFVAERDQQNDTKAIRA